jgi:DNA-binding LacI/PurR family transcriptional regulator
MLDHRTAARFALKHLKDLGHKRIAFLRGQQSSDSVTRWEALEGVAKELRVCVLPELVMQIEELDSTPDLGYP